MNNNPFLHENGAIKRSTPVYPVYVRGPVRHPDESGIARVCSADADATTVGTVRIYLVGDDRMHTWVTIDPDGARRLARNLIEAAAKVER